ncbi:MAG: hypothetical protein WCK05_10010 [Planctomycetota bacterium]
MLPVDRLHSNIEETEFYLGRDNSTYADILSLGEPVVTEEACGDADARVFPEPNAWDKMYESHTAANDANGQKCQEDRPSEWLCGGQDGQLAPGLAEKTAFQSAWAAYEAESQPTSDDLARLDSVGDPRLSLSIALRRLTRTEKAEESLSPGCQLFLLPDSEAKLLEEISEYKKYRRVSFPARRYSMWLPYKKAPAPEDHDDPKNDPYVAWRIEGYTEAEAKRRAKISRKLWNARKAGADKRGR